MTSIRHRCGDQERKIKEYINDLKLIKSNLKKVYNLVYGNCIDSVQIMLKIDESYDVNSKYFTIDGYFQKSEHDCVRFEHYR